MIRPPTIYKRCAGRKAKQMSNLKKDIDEIVLDVLLRVNIGVLKQTANSTPDIKPEKPIDRTQAVNNILNLIESVIPEEKKDDIPGVIFNQAGIAYFDGWNECIADIKSKLIDGEKK